MFKKLTLLFVLTFCLMAGFSMNSFALSVGDSVKVEWKGKWWPAHIKSIQDGKYCIHYDGYSDSWDECVGDSRIRGTSSVSYSVGQPVNVEWKGKWWPAKVLKVGDSSWYIHYDGYDSSWDEWVGPKRIKSR